MGESIANSVAAGIISLVLWLLLRLLAVRNAGSYNCCMLAPILATNLFILPIRSIVLHCDRQTSHKSKGLWLLFKRRESP